MLLCLGDILYIPKLSWIFIEEDGNSNDVSFIAYHFDIFPLQEVLTNPFRRVGVFILLRYQ